MLDSSQYFDIKSIFFCNSSYYVAITSSFDIVVEKDVKKKLQVRYQPSDGAITIMSYVSHSTSTVIDLTP